MNIAGMECGGSHPCRVIVDLSNSHNQDFDRCLRLIDAVHAAGADIIKAQCFLPDELIALRGDGPCPEPWASQGYTMRTLYEKAQTPHKWFKTLFAYTRKREIPFFSSVFGPESLALLESFDCPAFKLAALDYGKKDLEDRVYAIGKPVLQSCALAHTPWMADSQREGFLWCPPGYPQSVLHLANIRNGYLGFSYHGQSYVDVTTAVAVGARVIEVHVMPEDGKCLEANVSWTPSRLRKLIDAIRETEVLLG